MRASSSAACVSGVSQAAAYSNSEPTYAPICEPPIQLAHVHPDLDEHSGASERLAASGRERQELSEWVALNSQLEKVSCKWHSTDSLTTMSNAPPPMQARSC